MPRVRTGENLNFSANKFNLKQNKNSNEEFENLENYRKNFYGRILRGYLGFYV
jgi:hypothetical protein